MKIKWLRGNDRISMEKPDLWFVQGVRGSGKSSLLEHLAELHLKEGHAVLDLFGGRDGEALAWLRSRWTQDKKVLLIRGESVDVASAFPTQTVQQFTLGDLERYDIIICASPLFSSFDQEFYDIGELTEKIYRRLHWNRLVYAIMREASNFLYSRMKLTDDQHEAKAAAIYLLREMRHNGVSFGLDSVRLLSIDIDIRGLSDYMLFKAQGIGGLSRELRWIYRYFQPRSLNRMPPDKFVVITRRASLGWGVFPPVSWHKREKEDILRAVDIRVEYGEVPKEAEYKGSYQTVSDREHAQIVALYIEGAGGMDKIGQTIERSSKTVKDHVDNHNHALTRSGFCPSCRAVRSQYEATLAKRM